jgi:hypothetical protein
MDKKNQFETSVVKPNLSFFEKDTEFGMVDIETEHKLDTKIREIEDFIKNNSGKDQTDEVKDSLYANAIQLWNGYAEVLRNCKYTFYLNKKQYTFLTELIIDKMEYDVNTVFFAIELTDMLGAWRNTGTNKDDNYLQSYQTNATEITYIYHLISKHKVKGLSHASYRFSEVLLRIGMISKIIGYYDTTAKNLSKEIQEWVADFEPVATKESLEKENQD